MYKRLKECKTLREIFEVLPEEFYEKGSFVISLALFMMIIFETFARYILRHQTLDKKMWYFNMVGYVAVVFAVIWLVSRCYKTNKDEKIQYFKTHIWDAFFIVFLILSVIASFASGDFVKAFCGGWMMMCGLRTFFMIAGFYICGKNIKNENYIRILWWMFVITSTVQGMLIFTKYIGFYGSYCGGFYNLNHTGYFMCMAIMAAETIMLYEKNIIMKVISGILMGWNIWILVVNNTFGGYVAIMAGIIFMIITTFLYKKENVKVTIVAVGIFAIASAAGEICTGNVTGNFIVAGNDMEKITNNSDEVGTVGTGRGQIWLESIEAIEKRPIFGYGPDMLLYVIPSNAEPHNELLQIGAEEGLIALVAYIFAIGTIFLNKITNIKKEKNTVIYSSGILAAYFVSGMFGIMIFSTAPFFYLILGNISHNNKQNVEL